MKGEGYLIQGVWHGLGALSPFQSLSVDDGREGSILGIQEMGRDDRGLDTLLRSTNLLMLSSNVILLLLQLRIIQARAPIRDRYECSQVYDCQFSIPPSLTLYIFI
jgi:hypothetical protein